MAKKKRPVVMVTGAGGALAWQTIQRLRKNCDVVALDFRRKVNLGDDVKSFRVDFNKRRFEDIFREFTFDGVIHLGRIGADISSPFFRYNANVLGTQRLLDLCKKYGVGRVVVLSTFFVYGASPYNPALLTEDTPLKASNLSHDLVDSVELENVTTIYLYKHPDLHITVLRPTNIAGPRIGNNIGRLLSSRFAPVLVGFSPMMQFLHVEDAADAVVLAFEKNKPGIYNVAPDDWISYKDMLHRCGCIGVPVPSVPGQVPKALARTLNFKGMPSHLVNYFKYPVIIDGTLFKETFGFSPQRTTEDIAAYYRRRKEKQGLVRELLPFQKKKFGRRASDNV
ncbi:MAG: SDR family oxidoreductase [Deltaproteobacteria bacterium]|nr:SDR family oxidoreductase [Deltaproteobacteria bacterium]